MLFSKMMGLVNHNGYRTSTIDPSPNNRSSSLLTAFECSGQSFLFFCSIGLKLHVKLISSDRWINSFHIFSGPGKGWDVGFEEFNYAFLDIFMQVCTNLVDSIQLFLIDAYLADFLYLRIYLFDWFGRFFDNNSGFVIFFLWNHEVSWLSLISTECEYRPNCIGELEALMVGRWECLHGIYLRFTEDHAVRDMYADHAEFDDLGYPSDEDIQSDCSKDLIYGPIDAF